MIDKIKGLRKYTDCSMPSNEQQRIEKAECAAYNQAIDDVVKLFAIHDVVGHSEQFTCKRCGTHEKVWSRKKALIRCWHQYGLIN